MPRADGPENRLLRLAVLLVVFCGFGGGLVVNLVGAAVPFSVDGDPGEAARLFDALRPWLLLVSVACWSVAVAGIWASAPRFGAGSWPLRGLGLLFLVGALPRLLWRFGGADPPEWYAWTTAGLDVALMTAFALGVALILLDRGARMRAVLLAVTVLAYDVVLLSTQTVRADLDVSGAADALDVLFALWVLPIVVRLLLVIALLVGWGGLRDAPGGGAG